VEDGERDLYWATIPTFIQADTGKGKQLYAVRILSVWTESLNQDSGTLCRNAAHLAATFGKLFVVQGGKKLEFSVLNLRAL
jgi:hypothetical protein